MLKLGVAASPGGVAVLLAQTSENPAQFFTQLGIASAVCFVLYLWLRDVTKQRDRALAALETIQPTLEAVKHAMERSNDAHITGAEAAKAVTVTLQNLPDAKVWYKLDEVVGKMSTALGKLEALEQRRPEG